MKPRERSRVVGRLSIGLLLLNVVAGSPAFALDERALGRLFYTAQERRALDAQLRGQMPDAAGGPVELAPSALRFNGFVHRSLGASTAWVDGAPLAATPTGRTTEPARAMALRGETLRVEREGGPFDLRAGQRLTADGKRVDGDGRVVTGDVHGPTSTGPQAQR